MRERAGALNSELEKVGIPALAGMTVGEQERSRWQRSKTPPLSSSCKHLAALPCKHSRRATTCKQIVQKRQQITNSNRACNDSHQ